MNVLAATDFFTTEVWTKCGFVTYYVLFFIKIGSRRRHHAVSSREMDDRWDLCGGRRATGVPTAKEAPHCKESHDDINL